MELIEHAKWRKLEGYHDPEAGEYKEHGIRISSDGVLAQIAPIIDRETPQAKADLDQLREMGYHA